MISIIVPCLNEQEVLPVFYERINMAAQEWGDSFEVIVVDDGSSDSSWAIISEFNSKDDRWKAIRFSRNFGHQKAVSAGLAHANGDCAVILDADLQDPPEEVSRFIQKWKDGYEVVYAIRTGRKEGILKRACYKLFYRVLDFIAGTKIPLDSGDFCLIDRKIIDLLNAMPEQDRFVRGLRAWLGFRQIGVRYERHSRSRGVAKYTFRKLKNLAFSGIFSFSIIPLEAATYVGIFTCVAALVSLIFLHQKGLFLAMFFLGGVQLICLGIIGEYIGRIYIEVKHRPLWIIRDTIGIKGKAA